MVNWIDLEGLANLRDVGGIPTTDGGAIADRRLLRSDNLQALSPSDIDELRRLGLTDVIDLRSTVETVGTGPGPLAREGGITIHHHTLFREDPEPGESGPAQPESSAPGGNPEPVEVGGAADGAPPLPAAALPWANRTYSVEGHNPVISSYLSYLQDRPDSVLAALRAVARAPGAALVHCAAGKDRTGTVVALSLLVAGAEPEAVIADYAASNERMERIVQRLRSTPVYAENLEGRPMSSHETRPATMQAVIEYIDAHGGVFDVLGGIGWTDDDTSAMRRKLLG